LQTLEKKTQNQFEDAVIIICTTPYSRRIPQKCFKNINGLMSLAHILKRIESLEIKKHLAIPFIDLHSVWRSDYGELVKQFNITMSAGDAASPLHRMAEYLHTFNKLPKYVVRITHDDILIDPKTITNMLSFIEEMKGTYCFCPKIIEGAGVEILRSDIILQQANKIKQPVEHVSYFVKGDNPCAYIPRESISRPYRLTMDYPEDVVVLEAVLRAVGNDASVDKICEYLDNNVMLLNYNKLPELTIYTCVRNASKYINETIESLLMAVKVSHTPTEYILIDDKSNDDTLQKAIKQLGLWDDCDSRVFINESNLGLASSSNIALASARGKYILRLDADDKLQTWAIDYMIGEIKQKDAVILYPDYQSISDNGDLIGAVKGNVNHHAGGALMNKRVLNELKFKEGLKHWDSLELYQRIQAHPELKIAYCDTPTFQYRRHDKSLSANKTTERMQTLRTILGKERFEEIYGKDILEQNN